MDIGNSVSGIVKTKLTAFLYNSVYGNIRCSMSGATWLSVRGTLLTPIIR